MALASTAIQPVAWSGQLSAADAQSIDTVDEAIRKWMESAQAVNLSDLDETKLQDLSAFLTTLKSSLPAEQQHNLQDLLNGLGQIQTEWTRLSSDTTISPLQRSISETGFQKAFIGLLQNATVSTTDGLDTAYVKLDEFQQTLKKLNFGQVDGIQNFEQLSEVIPSLKALPPAVISQLGFSPDLVDQLVKLVDTMKQGVEWKDPIPDPTKNSEDATKAQVQSLLDVIDALPANVRATLKLDNVKTALTDALNNLKVAQEKLDTALRGLDSSNPDQQAQIDNTKRDYAKALSVFRTQVANIKLNYFDAQGVPNNDAARQAQQYVLSGEEIWQENSDLLTSQVDLTKLPVLNLDKYKKPAEYLKALEDYKAELNGIHQLIAKSNPQGADQLLPILSNLDGLIAEFKTSSQNGQNWGAGVGSSFTKLIEFTTSLLTAERAQKLMLSKLASVNKNTVLADQLKSQADALDSILKQLNQAAMQMLDLITGVMNRL